MYFVKHQNVWGLFVYLFIYYFYFYFLPKHWFQIYHHPTINTPKILLCRDQQHPWVSSCKDLKIGDSWMFVSGLRNPSESQPPGRGNQCISNPPKHFTGGLVAFCMCNFLFFFYPQKTCRWCVWPKYWSHEFGLISVSMKFRSCIFDFVISPRKGFRREYYFHAVIFEQALIFAEYK